MKSFIKNRRNRVLYLIIMLAMIFNLSFIGLFGFAQPSSARTYPVCPDMNNDHRVNLVDLAMYGIALNNQNLAGDFSHDGVVNRVDTAIMFEYYGKDLKCKKFVSTVSACIDANEDGIINLIDLAMFAMASENDSDYDFNGDGYVNSIDLAMLAIEMGNTNYTCPEPDIDDHKK